MNDRLLKQFRKWAFGLLKVNPDYVQDPRRLRDYGARGRGLDAELGVMI